MALHAEMQDVPKMKVLVSDLILTLKEYAEKAKNT